MKWFVFLFLFGILTSFATPRTSDSKFNLHVSVSTVGSVVVYHDVNQNKICDKNFFGVPTEGYAFSNNVRPNLSVPSFEDCCFKFQQDRSINIKMVY
jgi:hypothetical protein